MARSPRHRTRRRILWGLAVVATLLVLDLAWATWTTASGLTSAREDLQTGADLLRAGDPQGAGVAFQDAENAAGGAAAAMGHPSMLVVRALPWVGDDAGAVATMARAAEATATGGGALVDAVIRAGWTGEGVPALGAGGTIDLEAVAAAAPPLRTAADELTTANDDLATVDADGLTEAVATRLVTARDAVDEAAGVVSTASDHADSSRSRTSTPRGAPVATWGSTGCSRPRAATSRSRRWHRPRRSPTCRRWTRPPR
jgi:hypothetical protein